MGVISAMYTQHRWFFVIFFFCAALFLANALHFLLFRLIRRKTINGAEDWLGFTEASG